VEIEKVAARRKDRTMHVTHQVRQHWLEKVAIGAVVVALIALAALSVVDRTPARSDLGAGAGSDVRHGTVAQMDAADAGMRKLEQWEITQRAAEQDRVAQTNAMDRQRRVLKQIELQFLNGRLADEEREDNAAAQHSA
jgi:hypothetical protein